MGGRKGRELVRSGGMYSTRTVYTQHTTKESRSLKVKVVILRSRRRVSKIWQLRWQLMLRHRLRDGVTIDSEKDIDYINDRNKVFNEKLERNLSKYA